MGRISGNVECRGHTPGIINVRVNVHINRPDGDLWVHNRTYTYGYFHLGSPGVRPTESRKRIFTFLPNFFLPSLFTLSPPTIFLCSALVALRYSELIEINEKWVFVHFFCNNAIVRASLLKPRRNSWFSVELIATFVYYHGLSEARGQL